MQKQTGSSGSAHSQERNYYPIRGFARDAFRSELLLVWSRISHSPDPRACGLQSGLWVVDGDIFLTHTRKLISALFAVADSAVARKKSSINTLFNGLGCRPRARVDPKLVRAVWPELTIAACWKWCLRVNAIFAALPSFLPAAVLWVPAPVGPPPEACTGTFPGIAAITQNIPAWMVPEGWVAALPPG